MRIANFNAGPAALPEAVLQTAAAEMLDWHGCGMSVMEMSHRGAEFKEILATAEADLRELLAIPTNYRVLFMQGGGTGQFAAVPLNLMCTGSADYVISGRWAQKAAEEAAKYGTVRACATSKDTGFDRIPALEGFVPASDASYVYICQNETVNGTAFHELPACADKPLVADLSSCFLSEPADVSKYGLIYAGVQKNVGPAGVVVVIVREDLIGDPLPVCPAVLSYKVAADNNSLYNTPPCWNIYMCGLVFQWLKQQGGLEGAAERNHAKAQMLYERIDNSKLFRGVADPASRSIMNVTFTCGSDELDSAFVAAARTSGLSGLKGHRSVGGLRASLYNAVSAADVERLIACMDEFERSCSSSSSSWSRSESM